MKKIVAVVSLGAIGLIGGCASVYTQSAIDDRIDYQKVALVEQWAMRTGAVVIWVNYPLKSSAQQQQTQPR